MGETEEGEDVTERGDFAAASDAEEEGGMDDETDGHAFGDAEGEGHGEHDEDGGDGLGEVGEIETGGGLHHEDADDDEGRGGGDGGDDGDEWIEEEGEEEAGGGGEGGEAGAPTGFDTLATGIWSATSEAFYARAALPALLLLAVSSLSVAIILSQDRAHD